VETKIQNTMVKRSENTKVFPQINDPTQAVNRILSLKTCQN